MIIDKRGAASKQSLSQSLLAVVDREQSESSRIFKFQVPNSKDPITGDELVTNDQ